MCVQWGLKSITGKTATQYDHIQPTANVQVPQWLPSDMTWQLANRCFECRVDNQTLAAWMAGTAVCEAGCYRGRVAAAAEVLRAMVQHEGWSLRQQHADWVVWQPRERNKLADMLANLALDKRQSIAVRCQSPINSEANFITVSDGASRSRTNSSSAAWALLAVHPTQLVIIAAGAVLLERYVSSMEAELAGLELAIGALLKLSRGYEDIVPHDIQTNLDSSEFQSSYHHLWSISV
jgi:hypothetical protein